MKVPTIFNQDELNKEYIECCKNGDLEKVKFYLTNLECLHIHGSLADIHAGDNKNPTDAGLFWASYYNFRQITHYLLTSAELRENNSIHSQDDIILRTACSDGNLDTVEYLLTDNDLTQHGDIHAQNDEAFRRAYLSGHTHILEYLIFNYQLCETMQIQIFMDGAMGNLKSKVVDMFTRRDLNTQLKRQLAVKAGNKLTNKI